MPKTKSSSSKSAASSQATTVTRTTVAGGSGLAGLKELFTRKFNDGITLGALGAELVGTFGLVALLLSTNGNAIIAGVSVLIFVMAFGKISGGHINPAITIAMLATRQISWKRALCYIVVQILGAMIALVVISQFVHSGANVQNPYTGEMTPPKIFALDALNGDWRPFFAEALGALILGIGVAAAKFNKREGLEAGYMIGGALILGLLLATQGSAAVLNPAAAVGLDGYKFASAQDWWTLGVYAIAPIIGVTVGAWLYKVLHWSTPKEA